MVCNNNKKRETKKKKSIEKCAQNKREKENLKLANTVINQFYITSRERK